MPGWDPGENRRHFWFRCPGHFSALQPSTSCQQGVSPCAEWWAPRAPQPKNSPLGLGQGPQSWFSPWHVWGHRDSASPGPVTLPCRKRCSEHLRLAPHSSPSSTARKGLSNSHFTEKETGSEHLGDWFQVTQLFTRTGTPAAWLEPSFLLFTGFPPAPRLAWSPLQASQPGHGAWAASTGRDHAYHVFQVGVFGQR